VRVFRIGGGPVAREQQAAPPLPSKPSIVVLPFVNMSGDADQEFFADGLTEDILTELSRLPRPLHHLPKLLVQVTKARP
jgi:adenylate cyclase